MKKQLLKTFKLRVLALVALLCTGFAGQAEVTATYSLTPDKTSTGSSATSYITTLTEFTYNEISWKMNQWNPSTLQVKTNQSSATSEFRFYNTSAFSGRITQVVITFSSLTVSDASKLMFLGGTAEVTATTGGTAGTWNETSKTLTWTPGASDNFTYFAFYQNGKAASGTNNLASENAIVVTYETSGGSTTETVASPTFTPEAGEVESGTQVTIDTPEGASGVMYSFDGETYQNYTSPIEITEEKTIYAKAFDSDNNYSEVVSATYTIKTPAPEPNEGDYVKVTSTKDITDGEYLIVYEEGGLAFNGGLTTLDAASNTINVTISNNTIAGSETVDAAAFTINADAGSIKSASGYYIGQTSDANGLASNKTTVYTNTLSIENGDALITGSGNAVLRYNATAGQTRFRYFKSTTYVSQKAIALYKKVVAEDTREDANFSFPQASYTIEQGDDFNTPTLSKADGYDGTITYTISGDDIATINSETGEITLNGSAGSALITATGTGSTKFKDDEDSYSLIVAAVCQNIAEFKALADGTTSKLKLTGAQVVFSGGDDIYVKDNTGAIDLYKTGLPFKEGAILEGTITGTYTRYNGLPELKAMTANTLNSTENQNVEPIVLNSADDISNYECQVVSIANQSVSLNNTRYYIGNIQLYNKYYKFGTLIEGATYDVTGIAIYYKTTSVDTWEIAPRTEEDLVAHTATFTIAEACTDGDKYYGTYSNESAFAVPEDLTVSEISVDGDGILTVTDYETGDIVPANTGVMVSSTTAGEKSLVLTTAAGTAKTDNNMLKASSVAMEGNYKFYRLTMHDGKTLGFYYGADEGAAFALGANKAYLAVPASSTGAKEGFALGETTGINNVNVNENESNKIFNLAGQQMKSAVKGVYIKNGKKYIK